MHRVADGVLFAPDGLGVAEPLTMAKLHVQVEVVGERGGPGAELAGVDLGEFGTGFIGVRFGRNFGYWVFVCLAYPGVLKLPLPC